MWFINRKINHRTIESKTCDMLVIREIQKKILTYRLIAEGVGYARKA